MVLYGWGDGAGELGIGSASFHSTPVQRGFTVGEWSSKFSAVNRFSMLLNLMEHYGLVECICSIRIK
jgi:hypothetical protein